VATIADEATDRPVVEMPKVEDIDLITPIPPASEVALEEINLANGRLFSEDRCWEYFDRLREEDPVHLNETDFTGRYWSLTRYDDIKAVDMNDAQFSSEPGIVLGPRTDARLPEDNLSALNLPMFISMDDPQHSNQRRTVSPIVGPSSLLRMEPVIRERARDILDNLPIGETFNWVDKVSIELTTRMLATLFDFPYEDRRKLTWWSDVATAQPGLGIIDSEEERAEIHWGNENIVSVNFIKRKYGDIEYSTIKHLPKNIKEEYQLESDQKHRRAYDYKKELPADIWNYYKFAIVRNPWDRLVSEYFWRKQIYTSRKVKLEFTDFVKKLQSKTDTNIFFYNHIRPQKSYLVDDNTDKLLVDDVFRFEEMDSIVKNLNTQLGCDLILEHRNKTKHQPYHLYYTTETRELVHDIYQDDIEMFGFKFE